MSADDYDDPSDIDEIGEYLSDADEYDGDPPGYEDEARAISTRMRNKKMLRGMFWVRPSDYAYSPPDLYESSPDPQFCSASSPVLKTQW